MCFAVGLTKYGILVLFSLFSVLLSSRSLRQSKLELEELEYAWRIQPSELTLLQRLDAGSVGAFGEVWLANLNNDTQVAVKKLKASLLQLDNTFSIEFENEIKNLR